MNVLIGPLPQIDWIATAESRGHSVRTFGFQAGTDYAIDYRTEGVRELFQKLQGDWHPDLLICWSPVYYPFLKNVELCSVPTAAIIGDWNNALSSLLDNVGRFDWILTDRMGCNVFRKHGFENVEYYPMYSYDPSLHRKIPDSDRIYDVVFAGYLEGYLPGPRLDYLGRLAGLGERYRVKIVSGASGEEHVNMLNQAKIGFNHSIRGEMNMRAYEVPACGAMLMMESDNQEVGDFLIPEKECVLYDEDNFEKQLEEYLGNDDLREEIAEAGHRRILRETHDLHFADLIDRMEALIESRGFFGQSSRRFHTVEGKPEISARYFAFHPRISPQVAIRELANVVKEKETAGGYNDLAVFHARLALVQADGDRKQKLWDDAAGYFEKAASLGEDAPLIQANYGEYLLDSGRQKAANSAVKATKFLDLAIRLLKEGKGLFPLAGEIYQPPTDPFRLALEEARIENDAAAVRIFRGRLLYLRAQAEKIIHQENGGRRISLLKEAVAFWPESVIVRVDLVEEYCRAEEWDRVEEEIQEILRLMPLRLDILRWAVKKYQDMGDETAEKALKNKGFLLEGILSLGDSEDHPPSNS